MKGLNFLKPKTRKPRRNTLFSRAAIKLSPDEIMYALTHLNLPKNKRTNIEHAAGYNRSLNNFMKKYYMTSIVYRDMNKAKKKQNNNKK